LFRIGVFSNRKLNAAALAAVVLMAMVCFIPPVADVFSLIRLPGVLYLEAIGLSLVPLAVLEVSKALGLVK